MLTSRTVLPLVRESRSKRDTRLIIIATEGSETEKQYFDNMFRSSRCKIIVIPSTDGKSAPNHVFSNIEIYKDENREDLEATDEFWLVFDYDRWGTRKIVKIAKEAAKKGYRLAISNPCFEYWLYLHYDYITGALIESTEMESMLREKLGGYNKSKFPTDMFKGRVKDAIRRADKIEDKKELFYPKNMGTHVHRVVKQIVKYLTAYQY